jgi:hypothetical protein
VQWPVTIHKKQSHFGTEWLVASAAVVKSPPQSFIHPTDETVLPELKVLCQKPLGYYKPLENKYLMPWFHWGIFLY